MLLFYVLIINVILCFLLFLIDVVSEYFKQNPIRSQEQVGLPPIGYENKTRQEVIYNPIN